VEEQLNVLDAASVERKLVLVAPYREMAEDCTAQIASVLQMNLEAATPGELHAHQDADFFVSTPRFLRQISEAYPRIDVTGILFIFHPKPWTESPGFSITKRLDSSRTMRIRFPT
jgi:hypothetical protein